METALRLHLRHQNVITKKDKQCWQGCKSLVGERTLYTAGNVNQCSHYEDPSKVNNRVIIRSRYTLLGIHPKGSKSAYQRDGL